MTRRFQFSLRSILWAVAVVAVLCLIGPMVVIEIRARWFSQESPPRHKGFYLGWGGSAVNPANVRSTQPPDEIKSRAKP